MYFQPIEKQTVNTTQLLSLLSLEAEKIDLIMQGELKSITSPLLHDIISYVIFNGGKRIRPVLTVMSARLCQNGQALDENRLYRFALCFEFLHAASLLHDDVIDHAEQRRGKKSANRVWDNTEVILAGDFLHSKAMSLANSLGNSQCFNIACESAEAMVHSEFLQLETADVFDIDEQTYFDVLKGKTSALISGACQTGGIFAGASPEQCRALGIFGENLGLAFQIADDVLDYLGDSEKMGKALGNDLKEGKMTLPLIYTLRQAADVERRFLEALLLGDAEVRAQSFEKVKNIIQNTGGFNYACSKKQQLIDTALNALSTFPDYPEKYQLQALATYVSQRDR